MVIVPHLPDQLTTTPTIGTIVRYDFRNCFLGFFTFAIGPQYLYSLLLVRVSSSDSSQRAVKHAIKPGAFINRLTKAGDLSQDKVGPPEFPSYPCKHMPCSQTPVVSPTLA